MWIRAAFGRRQALIENSLLREFGYRNIRLASDNPLAIIT
jgi:hypothetical protein